MKKNDFEWVVIGAGPAGIASIGKLLDHGIDPRSIAWIDPYFFVGDLGKKFHQVPSNTKVGLFLQFLKNCKSFKDGENFNINELNPEENCTLQYIVEPLQWITNHLKREVVSITDLAIGLNLLDGKWSVKLKSGKTIRSKKTILAIGSEPKELSYPISQVIPIETALHPEKLTQAIHAQDTIAVFGSSHTAFLVLANLHKLGINTINFYRSPHRYAIYLKEWILFDDTGLKGFTADWAKKYIDGKWPNCLKRVLIVHPTFAESLSLCTKVIYATGFERRRIPVLEQFGEISYDNKTGIIAPNCFGIGIAFPQAKFNRLGHQELRVGLWKFMEYLNEIMPIWMIS
jgi:hypothetical protein